MLSRISSARRAPRREARCRRLAHTSSTLLSRDEASAAVTGLGGHVLGRSSANGLMALFGHPHAQENRRRARRARSRSPSSARLVEINAQKRQTWRAGAFGARGQRVRAGRRRRNGARCSATRRTGRSAAAPGCSRTRLSSDVAHHLTMCSAPGRRALRRRGARARGNSRACLIRCSFFASFGRAAVAEARSASRALTPFVGRDEELSTLARRW